jgi:hypothetical protein
MALDGNGHLLETRLSNGEESNLTYACASATLTFSATAVGLGTAMPLSALPMRHAASNDWR